MSTYLVGHPYQAASVPGYYMVPVQHGKLGSFEVLVPLFTAERPALLSKKIDSVIEDKLEDLDRDERNRKL